MKIIFENRKCLLKKIPKEQVRKRYLINFYDKNLFNFYGRKQMRKQLPLSLQIARAESSV